ARRSFAHLENDLAHPLLADVESIVHLALLGNRGERALPGASQVGAPKKFGVFGASDGSGRRAIKHLPAGRVVIQPFNPLRDHHGRWWLFTDIGRVELDVDPGST